MRLWQDGDDEVLRIEGSIFFGACHYIQQLLQNSHAQRVVIDARHINFIDYAGVEMLHQEARRLQMLQRRRKCRKDQRVGGERRTHAGVTCFAVREDGAHTGFDVFAEAKNSCR